MFQRVVFGLIVSLGLFFVTDVKAEKWVRSDGHVAHNRLAPVVMHRAFPPYLGVHVYEGRGNATRRGR